MGIYISPRVGLAAIFAAKGMKIPQGIKIGSSFKRLKAAYPRIKRDFHGYYTIKVPGSKKARYLVRPQCSGLQAGGEADRPA